MGSGQTGHARAHDRDRLEARRVGFLHAGDAQCYTGRAPGRTQNVEYYLQALSTRHGGPLDTFGPTGTRKWKTNVAVWLGKLGLRVAGKQQAWLLAVGTEHMDQVQVQVPPNTSTESSPVASPIAIDRRHLASLNVTGLGLMISSRVGLLRYPISDYSTE